MRNNEIDFQRDQRRYEEAKDLYRQALDIIVQTLGFGHPQTRIPLMSPFPFSLPILLKFIQWQD